MLSFIHYYNFTLVNVLISLILIVTTAFIGRILLMVKIHLLEIPIFKNVPRHPNTFAIKDVFDRFGRFENQLIDGMKNSDGSFKPVVNLGTWGNGHHYIAISDAEAFKTILPDLINFPKLGPSYNWFSILIGNGLVTSSGDVWKSQRKMITPLFHFGVLKRIVPVMVDITKHLITDLSNDQENYHPAKSLFALHAMRVIVRLAFGGSFDADWMFNQWRRVTHAFTDWTLGWCLFGDIWNYLPLPWSFGFKNARNSLIKEISITVDKRRALMKDKIVTEEDKNDLLSYLLDATDSDGNHLSNDLIINQSLTFLFAGHDTSSSALAWSMYYLATQPEALAKIREEVDKVLGDRDPTTEDLNQLNYTKDFMKEVLRIRPVIPIVDRITTSEVNIAGTVLPAGTYLGMFLWNVAHDTRYWDKPYEFRPERWTNNEMKDVFSHVPFSAGPRNCIGSKFAGQEIVIAIAMIARNLDIAYDDSVPIISTFEGVVEPKNLNLKFSSRIR